MVLLGIVIHVFSSTQAAQPDLYPDGPRPMTIFTVENSYPERRTLYVPSHLTSSRSMIAISELAFVSSMNGGRHLLVQRSQSTPVFKVDVMKI